MEEMIKVLSNLVAELAGEQEDEEELLKHYTEMQVFWIRQAQELLKGQAE